MPITRFELTETIEGVTRNHIHLTANKAAVVGVDAVTVSRGGASAATRHSRHVVKAVMSVRQTQAMPFDGQAQPGMRLDLKNASRVLDVLQRDKIHVAVEFVVGGEEVFE